MMLEGVLAACLLAAAERYALPPSVLAAVQAVEGGRPGLVRRNRDGSEDYGVMQINSVWLRELGRRYRVDPRVVRERLIRDGCYNIHVGAWILRLRVNEAGGDLWRGVGHYHSRTPRLAARYRARVWRALRRLAALKPGGGVPSGARG